MSTLTYAERDRLEAVLPTFGDRLRFARIFVLRVSSATDFAERLGFAASTYPTWEQGKLPRDKVEVAERIERAFPNTVSALWLLRGGDRYAP